MKKSKVLLLMMAVCACLAGCGGSTETTDEPAVETSVETEEMESEVVAPENAVTEESEDEVEEVAPEDAATEESGNEVEEVAPEDAAAEETGNVAELAPEDAATEDSESLE